ncbi:hypothetical protein COCVIDRAFT_86666, partial [Bipolaris victoriae FI3]
IVGSCLRYYTPKHGHDYPNHHGCTTYLYAKDIAPNPSLSSLIHTRTHTHTHTHTRVLLPHYSVPLLPRPQNGNLSVSTRLGSESTGFSLLTDWLGLESDVYL